MTANPSPFKLIQPVKYYLQGILNIRQDRSNFHWRIDIGAVACYATTCAGEVGFKCRSCATVCPSIRPSVCLCIFAPICSLKGSTVNYLGNSLIVLRNTTFGILGLTAILGQIFAKRCVTITWLRSSFFRASSGKINTFGTLAGLGSDLLGSGFRAVL